ncbi:hypothetical protein AVEN_265759-1 [Araneus ventricosus]|uniref:Uncharacterized protein n=1 Tax=Araneus ventricosus TaxID=182803 RepID=A0A4Y2MYW5_ARAVE|nr:hypothetical protein AVEN_265759-1 [Araneus ventricosus]
MTQKFNILASYQYKCSVLKQLENYFGRDFVILYRTLIRRGIPVLAAPDPGFRAAPPTGRLTTSCYSEHTRPRNTADLQWNRVSNLELSEAETLPLCHLGHE